MLTFQKDLSLSARSVCTTLFFDSQAWMATTLQKDRESGRMETPEEINHHMLNIATISAGVAIELIYKALALAEGGPVIKKHDIGKLHNAIPRSETKREIEKTLNDLGWPGTKKWVEFTDEEIEHDNRRYWNYDPNKIHSRGLGFVIGIDIKTIPAIAKVHLRLSDLARQRIWENWESVSLVDVERERSRNVTPETVYGASMGPLLATLNLPAGFAGKGRILGGVQISSDTGEATIIPPETDEDWEHRKRRQGE